jgi:hypothetical protein
MTFPEALATGVGRGSTTLVRPHLGAKCLLASPEVLYRSRCGATKPTLAKMDSLLRGSSVDCGFFAGLRKHRILGLEMVSNIATPPAQALETLDSQAHV